MLRQLFSAVAVLGGSAVVSASSVACTFELKDWVGDIVLVTNLDAESVPVATNDDVPVGGQIVNSVIALNKGVTINDVNIADSSVKVLSKPMDADDPNNDTGEYVYGVYTAVVVGAGNYGGSIDIKGSFGRLNP